MPRHAVKKPKVTVALQPRPPAQQAENLRVPGATGPWKPRRTMSRPSLIYRFYWARRASLIWRGGWA
ncbi:MAG: hypothetical protein WDN00_14970 [Limisphaerales bacterium]